MFSWRTAIIAMVITGLSCYALPLANTMSELALPHFGIGLGVGAVDAALIPLLGETPNPNESSQIKIRVNIKRHKGFGNLNRLCYRLVL